MCVLYEFQKMQRDFNSRFPSLNHFWTISKENNNKKFKWMSEIIFEGLNIWNKFDLLIQVNSVVWNNIHSD